MPITPFHLGAGLLIKAAVPIRFSLSAFAVVQVVIDIEVIVNVVRGHDPLHEFFHTWVGSLLLGSFCALLLLVIARRVRDYVFSKCFDHRLRNFLTQDLAPFAILSGAFIGALSHIALDGFMHSELNKPWLNLIDVAALHWYCLTACLVGLFGVVIGLIWRSKSSD